MSKNDKLDEILLAVNQINAKVGRMDTRLIAVEEKILKNERRQDKIETFQAEQTEKLEILAKKVEQLAQDPNNVVWQCGRQKGVEKEKVYDIIDELGLSRHASLDSLVFNNVIRAQREYDGTLRRTPKVRVSPNAVKRVIVVLI